MLLDELLPAFDIAERHWTAVHATPEQVFDAIRTANLAGGPVTRTLSLRAAGPETSCSPSSRRSDYVDTRRADPPSTSTSSLSST